MPGEQSSSRSSKGLPLRCSDLSFGWRGDFGFLSRDADYAIRRRQFRLLCLTELRFSADSIPSQKALVWTLYETLCGYGES